MITEIGIAAGDVWHYLDTYGEASFSEMIKRIDTTRDILLMSIGWLAREGHVVVVKLDGDYKVSLRK